MKIILLTISILSYLAIADYSGTWKYTVDTPEGKVSGSFILVQSADGYTGTAESEAGTTDLTDLTVEGNEISFHVYYQGYKVNVKGKFNENKMETMVDVEGMQFPLVAEKEMEME